MLLLPCCCHCYPSAQEEHRQNTQRRGIAHNRREGRRLSTWSPGRLSLLMSSLVDKDLKVRYKRSMLGYSRAEPSSTSFFRKKEKRVSKKIILAPLVRRKSPSIRPQNLSLYMKNSLLTEAKPYLTIIQDAASKNELVKSLILAVIKVESGFDSQAVSRKGAMGLMQLMPGTASDLGVTKPLDPEQNIFGGTKYLSDCLRTFKDLKLALAAYNAGPGRVAKLKRIPMIKETQKYVKDVIYYKELYDHLLGQKTSNIRAF